MTATETRIEGRTLAAIKAKQPLVMTDLGGSSWSIYSCDADLKAECDEACGEPEGTEYDTVDLEWVYDDVWVGRGSRFCITGPASIKPAPEPEEGRNMNVVCERCKTEMLPENESYHMNRNFQASVRDQNVCKRCERLFQAHNALDFPERHFVEMKMSQVDAFFKRLGVEWTANGLFGAVVEAKWAGGNCIANFLDETEMTPIYDFAYAAVSDWIHAMGMPTAWKNCGALYDECYEWMWNADVIPLEDWLASPAGLKSLENEIKAMEDEKAKKKQTEAELKRISDEYWASVVMD